MAIQTILTAVKNRADDAIVAATPETIWDPAAGTRFRLMRGQLSMSAAGQIILLDGATELLRSPKLAAAGIWEFDLGNGLLSAAADNTLDIDVSANAAVGGWVAGTEQ